MSHIKTSEGYDVKIPNQGQVTYNTVAGSAVFMGEDFPLPFKLTSYDKC